MSETRSVETTAPDIEEAIETGLKTLDVARENVIVEILDEPSRGLLGIGARMARVRLTTAVPPRSIRQEFVAPPQAAPSVAKPFAKEAAIRAVEPIRTAVSEIEGDGIAEEVSQSDIEYPRPEAEYQSDDRVERRAGERGDDDG